MTRPLHNPPDGRRIYPMNARISLEEILMLSIPKEGHGADVLVVYQSKIFANRLSNVLPDRFQTTLAHDERQMRSVLRRRDFDLLILGGELPDASSVSVCRTLRISSTLPIMFLLANDNEELCVAALEAGADDCVTTATNTKEVCARIQGLLRRSLPDRSKHRPSGISFDGWRIDPQRRILTDPNNKIVPVTGGELDVLFALCKFSGQVATRSDLLSICNGKRPWPTPRSIDVHINRLRNKIEEHPHEPKIIKTIRLEGYLFTPTIHFD